MLERLYVDNYRCLVNFECRFHRAQLILGANGSGKTTLFDVLALLRDFCVGGVQADGGLAGMTRTRWQSVSEQTFELDLSGNGGLYSFRLVVDSWGHPERPRVISEEVLFSGKPLFRFVKGEVHLFNDLHEEKVTYPFDWHRSALATITERRENTKLSWFKNCLNSFLFISPDPHQMFTLAAGEAFVPARNLSNFAAWYKHLKLENDDHALQHDLRGAILGFDNMVLKDAGIGNRFLSLEFSLDDRVGTASQNYAQLFHELSDGQRVLIGLYAVLHFSLKQNATLFFDEPDNFVSLKEIQPWLDKVLEKVEDEQNNSQALFISHHPELLNRLAYEGGLILDRQGGRQVRARSFTDPSQTGLTPAELVARGWEHE